MTSFRRVHMEARDPARNILRRWEIDAAEDLFGAWTVHVTFGRTAPVRIGVAYRLIADAGDLV